jgi:hypothetical protein
VHQDYNEEPWDTKGGNLFDHFVKRQFAPFAPEKLPQEYMRRGCIHHTNPSLWWA